MKRADVIRRLRAHISAHPSQADAAAALGVSPQLLTDVLAGRRGIGPRILAGLGLRRIEAYEEVRPER